MTMRMMLLALVASSVMAIAPAHAQGAKVAPPAQSSVRALRYVRMLWYNPKTWQYRVMTVDTGTQQVLSNTTGTGQQMVLQLMSLTHDSQSPRDLAILTFDCGERDSEFDCAGDIPTETREVNPAGEPKEKKLIRFAQEVAKEYNFIVTKRPDIHIDPKLNPAIHRAVNPAVNQKVDPAANPAVNPPVKPLPKR